MIDLERWAAEREDRWRRLSELLDLADRAPERELGPTGMRELLGLYRLVSSDLNRARSLTANPDLLGRLNALVGRGYRFIYRPRAAGMARELPRLLSRLGRVVGSEVPAAFRREAAAVALAAGTFLLGALFGAGAMIARPGAALDLIPRQFVTQSPRARVERIERRRERVSTVAQAAVFGSQLYTHNIQVAFLVFSLGALTLAGAIPLLFYNGVLLGVVGASYALDGVGLFFFAWVGPHGAFETAAIAFAGAAGMVAGRALLLPGELSRGAAVRLAFPRVWRMMAAVMLLLVIAGLIEGSFSQFSAKVVPYPLKIAVAVILLASLVCFLFLPRQAQTETEGGGGGAAGPQGP
jgi:uncharacterized membrane protein SpoIIM required for sporulation